MLLSPAFLVLLFVVLVPLLFSLYTSFTGYRLVKPDSLYDWVGLRNYERIFTDKKFWSAFALPISLPDSAWVPHLRHETL